MTRREVLLTVGAIPVLGGTKPVSRMAVEGYIFQQYAQSSKKPLGEVIEEAFSMSRSAGFTNVELNPSFFEAGLRERTLSLLRANGFSMPSVYVGGPMHTEGGAEQTIVKAIEIGQLCAPFGCKAVVNNPDPKQGGDKTDAELAIEADSLNRMGRVLSEHGFQLRVHHHTPQLANNAREWRYLLQNTNAQNVFICVDVDWAYEGGFEPLAFLRKVGPRLREIHVRSAKNKVWLEDLEDSDIDYRAVARYLRDAKLQPLVVVELAYRPQTVITRSLQEDLAISRRYARQVFGD